MGGTATATVVRCRACGTPNRVTPVPRGSPRCARCKAQLPWVVDADESSFAAETDASVPVVVDFWAPWCGPCRMVGPALEEMAEARAGRMKLVRVNVDQSPSLAAAWRAMSIPLLVVLRAGREVDRVVGALPRPQLEQRLAPVLSP